MTEFSIILLCHQSQILNMIFTTQTQLLTAQKRPITGKLNEGIKILTMSATAKDDLTIY